MKIATFHFENVGQLNRFDIIDSSNLGKLKYEKRFEKNNSIKQLNK